MHFGESIALQPERLGTSVAAARETLERIDTSGWKSARIGFVGIGASIYAARSAAAYMRSRGIAAYAFSAGEFLTPVPVLADIFIILSATGRSREVIDAVRQMHGRAVYAICVAGENPLAEYVQGIIETRNPLDSSPSAPSFTSTLAALGVLTDVICGETRPVWDQLPALATAVLGETVDASEKLAHSMKSTVAVDFVGADVLFGVSEEAALLTREVARLSASGFETRNYLHGPMEVVDVERPLFLLGDDREIKLAGDMAQIGATVALVTNRADVTAHPNLTTISIPKVDDGLADGVLRLLPAHHLIAALADDRALTGAGFRYRQSDTKLAV